MRADVAAAVAKLRDKGHIDEARAGYLLRVASGGLVSVRLELQLLLWAGVTMVAAGAGLLVSRHLTEIGPLAIALGLGMASTLCLGYATRHVPPFSWGEVPSPTLAFDYMLLLGLLLAGSNLAFVEAKFILLGPAWPWHLLIVSLLYLAAAYRYDSRAVLSLALTTFAAWRGVALTYPFHHDWDAGLVRWNALLCGALYTAAGVYSARTGRKPHFEPLYGNLGLVLLLGALLTGTFARPYMEPSVPWEGALYLTLAAVLGLSFRFARVSYFAIGVVAAYLALLWRIDYFDDEPLLVSLSAIGAIALLLFARQRMKGRGES
jgi:hypothetical protein